jgi:hypothetical protein
MRKPVSIFCLSIAFAVASLAADLEGSFDRSVNVSGHVDLDVQTDSGGIAVREGGGSTVEIHADIKAQRGWFGGDDDVQSRIKQLQQHPPIEQSGGTIRIGYVRDPHLLKGISMRFEIRTPKDTQLRAHADSGGIHVEGLQGPIECKTDSGGIDVRNAGAAVNVHADSGGIHLDRVNGSVIAHADSGGIEANDVAGSIQAKVDSGHIRISQRTAAPINVQADSGGVSLQLAPSAGYDMKISTDSGRISVPEMTVRSSFSRNHIEGQVRGGGPLVQIHVSSGGVSVE